MKHIYVTFLVLLVRLIASEGRPDSSLRVLSITTPVAERRCFATSLELRQAVDAYLYDDSSDTDVAATYGWPIGTWCVDAVENFDGLFSRLRNRRSATFNEDISEWNVARATSMKYMFLLARDFDQDLCAWGDLLDVSTTSFNLMFRGTSCTTKVAPYVDVVPAGPFCEYCFSQGTTSAPSRPTPSYVLPSVAPTTHPTPEAPSTDPTPEPTPEGPSMEPPSADPTPEPPSLNPTPEPRPDSPTPEPTLEAPSTDPTPEPTLTFPPTATPELIQCNQNRALSSGATILLNLTVAANEVTGGVGIAAGVQQSFFHFTYVIDVSGSTANPCDGTGRTLLDCEKEGLLQLNDRVIDANIAQSVSLVPFSSSASIAFTGDPDDPNLETSVNTVIAGGGTDFADALDRSIQTIEIALTNPDVTNTAIIFLSDGDTASVITDQVAMLDSMGTEIQSFAVGTGTRCTNQLLQMAVVTGGSCTQVLDPSTLTDVLGEVVLPNRTIDTVTLTVDGAPVPFSIVSPLPLGLEESPTDATASLPPGTPGVTREVCFGAASEGDEALCCVDI